MKRKAHTNGRKGKGGHSREPIRESRPEGQVKPVVSTKKHGKEMTYSREVTDGCAKSAAMIAALIIALLLFPKCGKTQTHFYFNTSTVVMVDNTGQMDTGSASWPVVAAGDSLVIGMPGMRLVERGLQWSKMGNGDMHAMKAGFRAHYKPGPGGKSLLISTAGSVRTIEAYEKHISKS
jgi:hypothetical protein